MNTVEQIEARIAISEGKARYCRALDTKDWALLRELMTEDFVLDVTEGTDLPVIPGRDAAIDQIRSSTRGFQLDRFPVGHRLGGARRLLSLRVIVDDQIERSTDQRAADRRGDVDPQLVGRAGHEGRTNAAGGIHRGFRQWSRHECLHRNGRADR